MKLGLKLNLGKNRKRPANGAVNPDESPMLNPDSSPTQNPA